LENVEIFYGHLEYFVDIWEILWTFGTFCVDSVFFSVLVSRTNKNLATLLLYLLRLSTPTYVIIIQAFFCVLVLEKDFEIFYSNMAIHVSRFGHKDLDSIC
jgi:hypothetical protein